MSDGQLRIELFGAPRVTRAGEPVPVVARPLCAVLLAMLALSVGRRLLRTQLASDLWPEEDEATATANLRRHLSLLTAALPPGVPWIERDRTTVRLASDAPVWCDVVAFENGEIDRYSGDFMEGYGHEWVLMVRERLRGRAVEALQQRAVVDQENDDYDAALAGAQRAVELDPLNETAAQLLIELYGERGDIEGLNRAFGALAERLKREIDARPNQATVELVAWFGRVRAASASRLPQPLTSFVGGYGAVHEIAALLPTHRLMTIVGAGGVGKTRLALEVAHQVAPTFADGAYFVDLSPVFEGEAVADAVLRALAVPTNLASRGIDGIKAFLQNRRALIVLDNCEQVVDSCGWLVKELLQAAPRVAFLATTREPFGLQAERLWRLRPLDAASAAALFVDRSSNVIDGSQIAAGATEIRDICERLDRLPLAIELAAGLTATLSLAQLQDNLSDRFGILRSRDRTVPARHRTLERVIEWSVDLLSPQERETFSMLPVFNGSFTLEAVRAICGAELPTLVGLLEKSMLAPDERSLGRYRLLISVAEFAGGTFAKRADAGALCDAHAAYYEDIVAVSQSKSFYRRERGWVAAFERDFSNIVAALQWTLLREGSRDLGVRLAIACAPYFERRGYYADGVFWVETAIEHAPNESAEAARLARAHGLLDLRRGNFEQAADDMRGAARIFLDLGLLSDAARSFAARGTALLRLNFFDEARTCLDRAFEIANLCDDRRVRALVLSNRGYLMTRSGDRVLGREFYARALPLYDEVGDATGVAQMFNYLAALDFLSGRYAQAQENLTRALATLRTLGDPTLLAAVLSDLGDVAVMQAAYSPARTYYAEALELADSSGATTSRDRALTGFAALAGAAGRAVLGARLIGASRASHASHVDPEADAVVARRAADFALAALSPEEFVREQAIGESLEREAILDLARSVT